MLQEEVIDIVTEELVEFLEGYIAMTSLTHEAFTLKIKENVSLEFGRYTDYFNWQGEQVFRTRHSIKKVGRAKVQFCFSFYPDEVDYAMQLVRLLDGYIEYGFSNHSKLSFGFTIDVGSKANGIEFFDKLNFLKDWVD